MILNLDDLRLMHPLLPASSAAHYAYLTSVSLDRHGHSSGASLQVSMQTTAFVASLHWLSSKAEDRVQLDLNRTTEDAAEGIALTVVGVAKGWKILRRMQRGEHADWLLSDPSSNSSVALEVSGIDGMDRGGQRMRQKTLQVGKCVLGKVKAACVVELSVPRSKISMASK